MPGCLRTDSDLGDRGITVIHTMACNIRCKYCFQKGHYYNGPQALSIETADRVVGLLRRLEAGGPVFCHHFGGEPSLNWRALTRIMSQAPEARHIVSTNGLGGLDFAEILMDYRADVVVSLDGLASTHDSFRVDARGGGTHARVLEFINQFPARYHMKIRATLDDRKDTSADEAYLKSLGRDLDIRRVLAHNETHECRFAIPAVIPSGQVLACHGYLTRPDWRDHIIGTLESSIDPGKAIPPDALCVVGRLKAEAYHNA